MGKNARIVAIISSLQLFVTAVFAILCLLLLGQQKAFSVLLGGGICVLATLLLGINMFTGGIVQAEESLRRFYSGEIQKLVLIAVFFALVFKYLNVDALYVICALVLAQLINLFALPLFR